VTTVISQVSAATHEGVVGQCKL